MTKAEKGYQSPGAELILINHQFPFEFYRFLRSNPSLTFVVYQGFFSSLYNQSSLTFLDFWGYIDIHNHRGCGWFNNKKFFFFFSFLFFPVLSGGIIPKP